MIKRHAHILHKHFKVGNPLTQLIIQTSTNLLNGITVLQKLLNKETEIFNYAEIHLGVGKEVKTRFTFSFIFFQNMIHINKYIYSGKALYIHKFSQQINLHHFSPSPEGKLVFVFLA